MDQKSNMEKVVEVLKGRGQSNEQIKEFLDNLVNLATESFFTEASQLFTEEDKKEIESCANQEEVNLKIGQLYQLRTGKDAQEEMKILLDKFVEGFLAGNDLKSATQKS